MEIIFKKILISKTKSKFEISHTEALAGKILSQLERNNIEKANCYLFSRF